MLNKQEKVGENNNPWVNMRQYKGFELQLTNVVLFFAWNRVTAYLSVLNSSEIPFKKKTACMIINSGQQAAQITRDPVFIHYIWTFLFTQILTGNVTFYFFPLTFSQWAAFHLKQWEDPSCYREPKPKHTIEKKPDKATGNVPATHTEVFFYNCFRNHQKQFQINTYRNSL